MQPILWTPAGRCWRASAKRWRRPSGNCTARVLQTTKNARPCDRAFSELSDRPRDAEAGRILLDLAFLELDVLAHDRVVFLDDHLLGHRTGVLLGDVEEAGVGGRVQADLDGSRLGHRNYLCDGESR